MSSDKNGSGQARGSVAAILVIVAILLSGLWLMHRLGDAGAVQDCVATGRRDCGSPGTAGR